MMTIQPGDFWVAEIFYTDGSSAKKRPILILWLDGSDVVSAAVTSATPRTSTDVLLYDWKTSGLRVPSTVRLSRLDCLEQSLLLFRLGSLSHTDAHRIQEVWQHHIQPHF